MTTKTTLAALLATLALAGCMEMGGSAPAGDPQDENIKSDMGEDGGMMSDGQPGEM